MAAAWESAPLADGQPAPKRAAWESAPVVDELPPVRAVIDQVVQVQPDMAAEVERLAKRYPAPYDTIERNVDDFRMFDIGEGIAAQLKGSPVLESAIRRNHLLGTLTHDNIEPLAKIESGFAKTAAASAAQAVLGVSEGIFRTPDAAQRAVGYLASTVERTGLPQYLNPIRGVQDVIRFISEGRVPAVGTFGGLNNVAGAIDNAQKILAEDTQTFGTAFADVQTLAKNADQALKTAITTGDLQQLGQVVTDPSYWAAFLSQAVPSLYLAMKSGGSTAFMAWMEGMEQAGNAAEFETKTGQKISDADFTQAVAQTALVNALLEKYGLDKVLGAKGNGLMGVAKAMAGEGGTEGLQQINSNLAALFSYNEEQGITEGVLASIMGGVGSGGAVATGQTALTALQDRQRQQADAAKQHGEALAEQLKTAGSALLRERSPEQFRALMAEMTDGKVWVDGEVLNQLPEDVKAQLPQAVRDQIADAAATGDTVEIPMADVLTIAPGTPLEQVLNEHARMDPFAQSMADVKAAAGKAQELLKAEAERVVQQAADQEAMRASAEVVRSSIAAEITATGRYRPAVAEGMSQWASAFYTTMASRVGMTPEAFYQQYRLRILGEPSAAASGPVMDQITPEALAEAAALEAEARQIQLGVRARTKAEREAGAEQISDATLAANRADGDRAFALLTRAQELRRPPAVVRETKAPRWFTEMADTQRAAVDALPEWDGADGFSLRRGGESAEDDVFTSASSNFTDSEVVPGVRSVPLEKLGDLGGYDDAREQKRIAALAERMREDKEITPIFVGVDETGDLFIMEGQHRARAFKAMGIQAIPAKIVVDFSNGRYEQAPEQIKSAIGNNGNFDPRNPSILEQSAAEYQGSHKPPGPDSASLADLTGNGVYPDDVYGPNGARYYGDGSTRDAEAFRKAAAMRGKPKRGVTVYRAVPKNAPDGINVGDWVALTRDYAVEHGEGALDGDYKILSKIVNAGDIYTNGDSIQEWGYWPPDTYAQDERAPAERRSPTPRGTFNPRTLELVLNPNANLSTFFHETGHFFLEVLADIASQPNAPAQIAEDMGTFLKWAGVPDLATWNALDLEGKRKYHERWAESIEQYVMEGRAPSVELQPLMRRFATWLKSVYGSIKRFLESRGQVAAGGGEALNQMPAPEGVLTGENGKPLVLYHGTNKDIKKFKPGRGGGAIWFAEEPKLANMFVGGGRRNMGGGGGKGSAVYPVYVTAENLLDLGATSPQDILSVADVLAMAGLQNDEAALGAIAQANLDSGYAFVSPSQGDPVAYLVRQYQRGGIRAAGTLDDPGLTAALQAAGFDGLKMREEGTPTYAVFDPKQIVSAISGEVLGQDPNAQPGPQMALNDDIRRVMDRLLATDEQIAQANEVAGLVPDVDADATAAERLAKRSIADLKWSVKARDQVIAKLRKQAAAIERDIREQVTVEVDASPEMRAKRALDALKVTPEYAGLLAEHKAQRKAAEDTTRAEVKAALLAENPDAKGLVKGQLLAKNKRDIENKVDAAMIKWDAANPTPKRPVNATDADVATIADSFGFESVDAMMAAINAFGPRREAIDGITERRMLEEHGDLIDERAITEAANEAVHNAARARSLATELRTQAEMLNTRQDTGEVNAKGSKITVNALVEAAKQFGANVVARTTLRDLKARAWQHTAAERRASKRWQEATAAGKTDEAVKAKQDQMLNHAAAKAAIDAQAEAKSILDFFRRVTKGNDETVVEKGRDPDLVNAARAVLKAYGVESSASKGAEAYLDALEKNDPETFNVVKPMVDAATANAQPLEALSFQDLQALNEEVRAIWFLAKRSRQMEVDGDLLDVEEVADEVYARLEAIGIPTTVPGETGALTKAEERARQWLQQAPALLRRVEQWAEAKDGKFGGPFLRFIFQPVKDAADRYRTDRLAYRQKFQALVDKVAPLMPAGTIAAPELNYTFGRGHNGIGHAELLHALLHTGNESNKRKLLLGRGWAAENADGTLDTARWDAFVKRMADTGVLQPAHYDFVQGVWDLMEETKPLAQKTHRDVFGRYFAEVTADSFADPWGRALRGGYVPAQADPLLVQDADLRELLETENAGMSQAFPATNRGFTKGRVEYNRPLKLDLRTLPQHIDKVLLFSHMEPAVRGVAKLLRQKKVSQPLARVDPAAMGGLLKPWLNRSARQTVETPISADAGLNRMASTIRGRVGMALMFANVSNTLQQTTGALTAAVKVKPGMMRRAAAQYIANPKRFKEAVWAMSPYMADRASNEVAVLSDTLEAILINPSVYQRAEHWTRRHGYFLQTALDNQMSPIIWTGAYNQALAEGMDERMAIRYADGVIRQTQGSTLPEDVSRIETGPAYARLFTQFIGYFNMMANTNATAVQQIAAEQGLRKGAGKAFGVLLLGLMAPIWVAEAIAHAMRGGPDDEDDDGYLDDWLAAVFGFGTIRGLLAGVPFIGAAAQSAVNRFNDQPADDKFSLSPTVSVLESAVGAPASVYGAIVDDKSAQKAVRDVSALITVATGLPAMAAARPVGYLAGVAQGKVEPTGPVDAARGVVTGTASPDSKQR